MYIILPVLLLLLLVSYTRTFLLNKQLQSIKEQFSFILNNTTNQQIQITSGNSEINELMILVNELLSRNREIQILSQKFDTNVKSMINNITHDLRTPLTVSKKYLQMLQVDTLDIETKTFYLTKTQDALQHLNERINILFEYTTFQESQKSLTYQKISISNILESEILLYYHVLETHRIKTSLSIEKNLSMYGHEDSFKSIIQNSISNVIHHGKDTLFVQLLSKREDILLSFSNQTIEVDMDTDSIFHRFYTADMARFNQNTGLGLPIINELVESHQGSVKVAFEDQQFSLLITSPKLS